MNTKIIVNTNNLVTALEQVEKIINTKSSNYLLRSAFIQAEDVKNGSYVQFCENIDYLNGWLYGVVQAVNGIIKADDNKSIDRSMQLYKIFNEEE